MGLMAEFRTFVQRGNVIDLAVAVVLGSAFGRIVTSFVDDVLMPPIGMAMGGVRFTDLALRLGGPPEAPVMIEYGKFLQASVDFLIVAFCVFLLVKAVNLRRRPEPAAVPAPSPEQLLLAEIRDLLRQRGA
jgi:large conductance mechanosensitive channel